MELAPDRPGSTGASAAELPDSRPFDRAPGVERRLRIDDRDFSVNRIISDLSAGRITRRNQAQVLDTLNLLWDIANTVQRASARNLLRAPRFREFLDMLTFVELGGNANIGESDAGAIARDVERAVRMIRPSIELLAPPSVAVAG